MLCLSWQALAGPKETATFIPFGFLPGDDTSSVYVVNDAVTLAGGYSFHREGFTRILITPRGGRRRWTATVASSCQYHQR